MGPSTARTRAERSAGVSPPVPPGHDHQRHAEAHDDLGEVAQRRRVGAGVGAVGGGDALGEQRDDAAVAHQGRQDQVRLVVDEAAHQRVAGEVRDDDAEGVAEGGNRVGLRRLEGDQHLQQTFDLAGQHGVEQVVATARHAVRPHPRHAGALGDVGHGRAGHAVLEEAVAGGVEDSVERCGAVTRQLAHQHAQVEAGRHRTHCIHSRQNVNLRCG